MNELMEFEGETVRMVGTAEKPEWIVADVCRVIGHTNSRMAVVDFPDDEKGVSKVYTPGGLQELATVTEPGLYRLLMRSNKAEAERFRRWIFHDVLPAIRKTGSYAVNPTATMSKAEWLLAQAQAMVDQEKRIEEQQRKVAAIEVKVDEAVRLHECNLGHFSVMGYAVRQKQRIGISAAGQHGKKLTKVCRDLGIEMGRVSDPRFGEVNTYPENVLADYFAENAW